MMYAELVDMDDFTFMMGKFGIASNKETDSDKLKRQIKAWLNQADDDELRSFWTTIDRIEDDGILLPDVENIICWSRQFYLPR